MRHDASESDVRRLWFSDLRNDELADALGVPRGAIYRIRVRFGLPARVRHARKGTAAHKPDPTIDEIAQRAAEIRSRWSRIDEESRWVGGQRGYQFPSYSYDGRTVAFSGMDR